MRAWTVEDEINLCKWVDDRGFKIVYLPSEKEWGFTHKDKPQEVNGGFKHLSDLKQYLVNLKGDKKNVRIVSQGDFQQEMEKAWKLRVLQ